jgi:micrococcal nuclease
MSTPEPFVYRLKALAKVVDGDTLDLDLDLGFSLVLRQRVRLYGLDAPEIRSKDPAEKAKGLESQAFVRSSLKNLPTPAKLGQPPEA